MNKSIAATKLDLRDTLTNLARSYPTELAEEQARDIPRIEFNIGLALTAAHPKLPSELEVCDLGGGLGMFSLGCAAAGFRRSVLIDDFQDEVNMRFRRLTLELHARLGVDVISRDLIADGIEDVEGTFDVITTFDSIEHWHHSPKTLFDQVVQKLKPGGAFVLGAPNCVNLRKRLAVPFGFGKWSRLEDWYERPRFRGHVREPDVDDLKHIASSMGLRGVEVLGRNWAGYRSPSSLVRLATRVSDSLLRLRPSLCSDIYVVGTRGI